MAKAIQIRNVPNSFHRILKSRAAAEGMSLSKYLVRELGLMTERPTLKELSDRLKRRKPVELNISAARLVRIGRDAL
jgi:antitoxin FitA